MRKKSIPQEVQVIISAKNQEQKDMLRVMSNNDITFVKGAPGSGKTHLAVAYGLQSLVNGDFEHLIFSRPVVEAGGEKLGFLPGNIYDKIDPYMMPIFDILSKLLPSKTLNKLMPQTNGNGAGNGASSSPIKIIPLAYMRGLSFHNSFIICDEAQNSMPEQIRMILTRLGIGSKIVICGDVYQTDINAKNGLQDAFDLLDGVNNVGFVTLTQDAIMRHPIIKDIECKYYERDKKIV